MARKSRRPRRPSVPPPPGKRQRRRPSKDRKEDATPQAVTVEETPEELAEQYEHVARDIRRIVVTSIVLFVLIYATQFFL